MREFVLADIPGLIEGAHEGAGLGDRFLGHVERCRVLLNLVEGTAEYHCDSYRIVRGELDAYGADLAGKPEIVALSKADGLDEETRAERLAGLARACGQAPLLLSSASGLGVDVALNRLLDIIGVARREAETAEPTAAWQP